MFFAIIAVVLRNPTKNKKGGSTMKKFRTVSSLILMLLAAAVGFLAGAFADDNPSGGAVLFALITGISCIIYTLDNPDK